MKEIILIFTFICLLFCGSGCATVVARGTGYWDGVVYPATRIDACLAKESIAEVKEDPLSIVILPFVLPPLLLDLPFSLATDTIMWPFDYRNQRERDRLRRRD